MHMWIVLWAFWTKGGAECPKRFPGPLWPRTIPSNMLPPEWTFNFSNYQSNAFCHSQPICFDFCRINLAGTIVWRWVAKVETGWYHQADLWKVFLFYFLKTQNIGKKIDTKHCNHDMCGLFRQSIYLCFGCSAKYKGYRTKYTNKIYVDPKD